MVRLETFKGKISLLLISGILILVAGFIVVGCGTDPQLKVADPAAGQCAVDFSLDDTNTAALISGNANYPSIAGNNLTVEAWVKPGAPTSTDAQGIFSRSGSAGVSLFVEGGKPVFAMRQFTPTGASTSTDYRVEAATEMTQGTWYHLAGVVVNQDHNDGGADDHPTITCDDGNGASGGESETPHMDIYVDGILEACATTWGDSVNDPTALAAQGVTNPSVFGGVQDVNTSYIGFQPHSVAGISGVQFQGTIDEVRLWTAARSAADIAACKDAELTSSGACALNSDILKGYWKMNECSGSDVADWSGAGSPGGIEKGSDSWTDGWVNPSGFPKK